MSDPKDTTSASIERPTWRFSGRRGTPVHMRDQPSEALPREIRKAIVELTKERSEGRAAPPVAAAPPPVERRAGRFSETAAAVGTPHVPAATPTAASTPTMPTEAPESNPEPATPQPAQSSNAASRSRSARRKKAKARAKAKAKAARGAQERVLAGDAEVEIEVETPAVVATAEPIAEPVAEPVETEPIETAEPVASSIEWPPAIAGAEASRQAAWELGRLPILLDGSLPARIVEEPEAEPSYLLDTIDTDVELVQLDATEDSRDIVELQPIAWRPIGPNPVPAPISGTELPPATMPAAIAELATERDIETSLARLDATRDRNRSDENRLMRAPSVRAADARHRVQRRRADLLDVVGSLEDLAARRP